MENATKILLTGFRGSSAELLVRDWDNYRKIILPNDRIKDSEMLMNTMKEEAFDYIISFGQKPNIRDKIYLETTGRQGVLSVETNLPWEGLRDFFQAQGLDVRISNNAGTSFCNQLYYNGLQYLRKNNISTKMIFIHIPFEKNISNLKHFRQQIWTALEQL